VIFLDTVHTRVRARISSTDWARPSLDVLRTCQASQAATGMLGVTRHGCKEWRFVQENLVSHECSPLKTFCLTNQLFGLGCGLLPAPSCRPQSATKSVPSVV